MRLTDGMVVLRLPRDTDVAAVVKHSLDPDLSATYWLPVPFSCTPEVARERIREFKAGFRGQFGLTLIVSTPANEDTFLGIIMLGLRNPGVGEVAYGVAPAHRNHGLATRALNLITGWACGNLALKQIELHIGVPKLASRRVAEKAGFVCEAIVRTRVPATGKEYDDIICTHSCSTNRAGSSTADAEHVFK